MKQIDRMVPRVGKYVINNPDTLQLLNQILPEKEIHTAIACRGTDRTLAPPQHMLPAEAPYRRRIMIIRHTEEIKYEANWERWDQLSQRQLVRPAHPCKINVTVFGRDRSRNSSELPNATEVSPEPIREEPMASPLI